MGFSNFPGFRAKGYRGLRFRVSKGFLTWGGVTEGVESRV